MSSSHHNNASSFPFERYDDEFTSLMEQIEQSLETHPPGTYTQNLLAQCDDLIKQMALEARSVPDANLKRELLSKVRECKNQYQLLQQQSERQGLLGRTGPSASSSKNDSERLLLQKNEDMLAQQNDTLERARRTMQETEQVALEITDELGRNRETIQSARGRVREVSGLTGRARRILVNMSQREVQQKMILYAVAGSLIVAFMIILWIFMN